jgi:Uma2 family endonuclease
MVMPVEHHRMTVAEFERFAADHPLDGVELIDGEIHDVSPETEAHAVAVDHLHTLLRARYQPPIRVLQAGSVRLDDQSLWNPDVYVYVPQERDTDDRYPHATELLLTVEVSLNTWTRDMGPKLSNYARNRIPEYWVIDPRPGGVFHRFTDPEPTGYQTAETTPLPDGIRSLPL